MMYCTLQQIKYLLGEHHCQHWQTIKDRIDFVNATAQPGRTISYHLRKRRGRAFDIQVHYDDLSKGHKGYLAYRERKALEATIKNVGGTAEVFDFSAARARLRVVS